MLTKLKSALRRRGAVDGTLTMIVLAEAVQIILERPSIVFILDRAALRLVESKSSAFRG